jgi:hypothetical protein
MSSKLVIVNSNHKLSGTDFNFKYNFGDTLMNGNYDMMRLRFIDLNIETTGVNATTDGMASQGILFCASNFGQDTICNNDHNDIFGYSKYHRGSADGYYQITQPNPIVMTCPVIRGIKEFKILDEDFALLTGNNINGISIIFQIEYFNKQELSDAVGDSFFSRQ